MPKKSSPKSLEEAFFTKRKSGKAAGPAWPSSASGLLCPEDNVALLEKARRVQGATHKAYRPDRPFAINDLNIP